MACTANQKAMIDAAFRSIPDLFRSFGNDKDKLFDKCLTSERQHRNGRPSPRGFSAHTAARYFAVKWLHEYSTLGVNLTVRDYLHVREECFFAAAMALEHQARLAPWAAAFALNNPGFSELDYAKLMD